ncbi:MAG: GNAT family N-acetyltransferase [Bdellovibrionales bacterium]
MSRSLHNITTNSASLCAALHQAAFPPGEVWDEAAIGDLLALPTTRGLLLLENNVPLGFVLWQHGPDWGEVLTLAVLPAARQQGIALELMQAYEAALQSDGMLRSVLDVGADNAAATALYNKTGYRVLTTRAAYYTRSDGRKVDALVLEKTL